MYVLLVESNLSERYHSLGSEQLRHNSTAEGSWKSSGRI